MSQKPLPFTSFPESRHDHARCVSKALTRAETMCRGRGSRLTALRRRVLELVWDSHAPVGAYEILRSLSREHEGAAPPTVYRALDFLLEHGLVHRIESLNAYVGCAEPEETHPGHFLICSDCGDAVELETPAVDRAIERQAATVGFRVHRATVEVLGLCPSCQGG